MVLHSALSCGLQPSTGATRGHSYTLLSALSCGLQPKCHAIVTLLFLPSPRTLVRVATAYMHKMFGACTDLTMCTLTLSSVKDAYLVVQGLIPTISTLGREVAPHIGAKQLYEIRLLPLLTDVAANLRRLDW